MDNVSISTIPTPHTARKAWVASLTTLATTTLGWVLASRTGNVDPIVTNAMVGSVTDILVLASTTAGPALVSWVATYLVTNKPK